MSARSMGPETDPERLRELARELDELASNAWPAEVVQHVAGWRCRFTHNVSRRANSAWANEWTGPMPLEERIPLVEEFYRRHGCPPRFHISPAVLPEGLDALLAERGYWVDAVTAVQVSDADLTAGLPASPLPVTLTEELTDEWLAAYLAGEGYLASDGPIRRGVLSRIGPPSVYAMVREEGAPVAVGQAVAERGWLGFFCIATLPAFRRRGAAAAIVQALAGWGAEYGVRRSYLQVMESNTPAISLYERLGFRTLYRYHYRELSKPRA